MFLIPWILIRSDNYVIITKLPRKSLECKILDILLDFGNMQREN